LFVDYVTVYSRKEASMSVVRRVKRENSVRPGGNRGLLSRELQELWFATRRREWKSLVVVPASPGSSAMHVAQALSEVGSAIRMSPVRVVNAEGMDLDRIAMLVLEVRGEVNAEVKGSVWTSGSAGVSPGGWDVPAGRAALAAGATIIAIEAVAENPLILPLALAADAVLLCVELGRTRLDDARHTMELIGRDRIIGGVLLRRT
jgi:hypothetical protein